MPDNQDPRPKGWHSRGYLPHFDGGQIPQGVTFRLADSLPNQVIERWKTELKHEPDEKRNAELRIRTEAWLDAGHGHCLLRNPTAAKIVQDALLYFDGARYRLHNWCVMPNHVHVLFSCMEGHALSGIVHSWKSFTAKAVNKAMSRSGQFWMEDYFDRYTRDAEHYARAMAYIDNNPVKAGLCKTPEEWPWCASGARASGPQKQRPGRPRS
jgi:REP element-mobilizing transposase RayT